MGYWDIEEEVTGEFDSGGGEFEPIPKNTQLLAIIESAEIVIHDGDDYISIRWSVLAPSEYKDRKIFQKIRIFDENDQKSMKAKKMLVAIDKNAGGKLVATGKSPTNESLSKSLVNARMIIQVQVWSIDGKTGNWVNAVSPNNKKQDAQKKQTESTSFDDVDSDDIPF